MRKTLLSVLTLALAAGGWSPIAAQETPMPSPAASTGPTTTTPATTTTKTAPVQTAPTQAGQPNFGQLMSSLNRMKAEVAQVQSLRGITTNDVHIVKVASISGTDTAALNSALSRNASQLAALRNALGRLQLTATTDRHTLTFAQFLADNRMTINQVIAADVSNGALTAFMQ